MMRYQALLAVVLAAFGTGHSGGNWHNVIILIMTLYECKGSSSCQRRARIESGDAPRGIEPAQHADPHAHLNKLGQAYGSYKD